MQQHTALRSDSLLLNGIIERSIRDLCMLRTDSAGLEYFAAGVPWFVTLFGRDTLITALQTLAFQPQIAAQTLRILARYQGQKVDNWRDKQPGKILHELRVGERARTGDIPHTPFYGTIDATPLFLILLGRHAAWTGNLTVFHELRQPVANALAWMAQYGDLQGDGYLTYQCTSEKGLVNQGWKDSGDAIVHADGSLATPPIALVEVQGYVFAAKHAIADCYERSGDVQQAQQLRCEAETLRTQFNRDFWREDLGTYALGIAEAAMHFRHYRLPEAFAGFARAAYEVPVRYPWPAIRRPGGRRGCSISGHHVLRTGTRRLRVLPADCPAHPAPLYRPPGNVWAARWHRRCRPAIPTHPRRDRGTSVADYRTIRGADRTLKGPQTGGLYEMHSGVFCHFRSPPALSPRVCGGATPLRYEQPTGRGS